jgi:hypothetical protein
MATLVRSFEAAARVPATRNRTQTFRAALAANPHYLIVGLLAAGLIPALRACRLPVRFAWGDLLQAWVGLMFQSVCLASLLYVLSGPLASTLGPVARRYWNEKRRLLLLAPFFGVLLWILGFGAGLVLTIGVLALLELMDRAREKHASLASPISAVMLPGAYLFAGLVLVFAYNNIIVSVRSYGLYDATFNHIDSLLLGGATVSSIAHQAARILPVGALKFLEFVYFGMFSQIGAGIILTGLTQGRSRALKLVGALLTAYSLALVCFYIWPSHGPYYSCPHHFAEFPRQLRAYATQMTLLARARSVWAGRGIPSIGTDYYIAFPCMHIAQPLIVMWFLRRWRRVLAALSIVNVMLVASIVLLEWHYLVDLLGGVVVAALAILFVNRGFRRANASPKSPSQNAVTISSADQILLCTQKDTQNQATSRLSPEAPAPESQEAHMDV